jgi:integrase/recombinase XerD
MKKLELGEAIDTFVDQYPKKTTRRAYFSCLTPFAEYVGLKRPVTDFEPLDLIRYHNHLMEVIANPSTRYKHIKTIKIFFNWLVKIEEIETSPAKAVKNPRPKIDHSQQKAMTEEEALLLIDYFKYQPREHAIIRFMVDTGCRIGGVADLKLEHLDLTENRAYIIEKGDNERWVYFNQSCAQALHVWLAKRPPTPNPYVFVHFNRVANAWEKYVAASISQKIRRACDNLGIRSLGGHSIRHFFGYRAAKKGVPVEATARSMGHSALEVTDRYYYNVTNKEVRETMLGLSLDETNKPEQSSPESASPEAQIQAKITKLGGAS